MGFQFAAAVLPAPVTGSKVASEETRVNPSPPSPASAIDSVALGLGNRQTAGLLTDAAKHAFLDSLEREITATAGERLEKAGRSAVGCPWIAGWISYYRDKSAAHLERAIRKFAPESARAGAASDLVAIVAARVAEGVDRWLDGSPVRGLPEGVEVPPMGRDPETSRIRLGEGAPLDGAVRSRMEAALGANLDDVRIHTGSRGAELASELGSEAVAVGQDIAFAAGSFQPGTLIGDALLAHELAHVLQQRGTGNENGVAAAIGSPAAESALEADANRSAFAGLAALLNGPASRRSASRPLLQAGGLRLQSCRSDAFRTRPETGNYVEFLNSHRLARHQRDRAADPLWVPGATDHAAAYTMGTAPTVAARTVLPAALSVPGASSVSVRVSEGGAVRGTRTGIGPASGSLELTGLALPSLTGSDAVRPADYTLQWEGSLDGANWVPLMTSGPHRIYWLFASPKTDPLYAFGVAKATRYAAGQNSAQNVAAAIRSGIRGVDGLLYNPSDPIDEDPYDMYSNQVGICTDYANLLANLALSVGLNANTVFVFGGFISLGKNIWATRGGYLSLVDVRSPNPNFNPAPNSGWMFTYHAIARIEGTLHDAALDRVGLQGAALHEGRLVQLVELDSSPLLPARVATPYAQVIKRKEHLVTVTMRDYGARIPGQAFSDVIALPIYTPGPALFSAPVNWSRENGSLPPGLSLNAQSGLVSGTPSAAGNYRFQIKTEFPGLAASSPVDLNVQP